MQKVQWISRNLREQGWYLLLSLLCPQRQIVSEFSKSLVKILSTGDKGKSEVPEQHGGRKEQSGIVCRWASTTGGLEDAPHLDLNS